MQPAHIGLAVGLALGVINFVVLRTVASRMEGPAANQETMRRGRILRMVAAVDLVAMPVLGWFVGPLVLA